MDGRHRVEWRLDVEFIYMLVLLLMEHWVLGDEDLHFGFLVEEAGSRPFAGVGQLGIWAE